MTEESLQQALESLVEAATLLGRTQAKRLQGTYTEEDSRFERAMNEAVYKHSREIANYLEGPVQRLWIGLTDYEIHAVVNSCKTVDTYKYFRAIEAKLKEMNA